MLKLLIEQVTSDGCFQNCKKVRNARLAWFYCWRLRTPGRVFLFWAGPFAPQQSARVSLGELAAEVGQSAVRKVIGMKQPDPKPIQRDIDDFLSIGSALGCWVALQSLSA